MVEATQRRLETWSPGEICDIESEMQDLTLEIGCRGECVVSQARSIGRRVSTDLVVLVTKQWIDDLAL